jgi:two-component sensor histidine kinase
MKGQPRGLQSLPHDYTPDIEGFRIQLTGLTQRWHGVAPLPPSLAEAVEELTATVEALHTVNAERTEAEQRVRELTQALAATRAQADWRVRESHHRLKNHLQVVSSLLDCQAQALQDPQARTILEACQGRLRSIALLHELLSRADDGERLALHSYLHQLVLLLFEAYGVDRRRVSLTIEAEEVEVATQTALSCGLIAHEVLANALQHALPAPQTGTISISLRAAPAGYATLTIRDTGRGLRAALGSDGEASCGLELVGALTEQLGGTLQFTHGGGTGVRLTFPR